MIRKLIGFLRFAAFITLTLAGALLVLITLPVNRDGTVFQAIARLCARVVLFVCGIRVSARGIEQIKKGRPYVYVSNHASLFDIPATIAAIPGQVRIVYKKELEKIPLFGWGMKYGSYIAIDRRRGSDAMKSLEEAAEKIRTGASALLYAEGTRTLDGKLQPFKRGAFNLAVKAGVPVVPLTINGSYKLLPKHSFVVQPGEVELVLDSPIEIKGTGKEAEMQLMEEVHAAIQKHYVDQ